MMKSKGSTGMIWLVISLSDLTPVTGTRPIYSNRFKFSSAPVSQTCVPLTLAQPGGLSTSNGSGRPSQVQHKAGSKRKPKEKSRVETYLSTAMAEGGRDDCPQS